MAFSTTTVQPVAKPTNEQPADNNATAAASLLSMLVLSVYAAKKSKKDSVRGARAHCDRGCGQGN